MKTLFSTLLLAFAVLMVSCGGNKANQATEEVAAPVEVVAPVEEAAPAPAAEEVVVDEAAKTAE